MSVCKLLSRIVNPNEVKTRKGELESVAENLHDHTVSGRLCEGPRRTGLKRASTNLTHPLVCAILTVWHYVRPSHAVCLHYFSAYS